MAIATTAPSSTMTSRARYGLIQMRGLETEGLIDYVAMRTQPDTIHRWRVVKEED